MPIKGNPPSDNLRSLCAQSPRVKLTTGTGSNRRYKTAAVLRRQCGARAAPGRRAPGRPRGCTTYRQQRWCDKRSDCLWANNRCKSRGLPRISAGPGFTGAPLLMRPPVMARPKTPAARLSAMLRAQQQQLKPIALGPRLTPGRKLAPYVEGPAMSLSAMKKQLKRGPRRPTLARQRTPARLGELLQEKKLRVLTPSRLPKRGLTPAKTIGEFEEAMKKWKVEKKWKAAKVGKQPRIPKMPGFLEAHRPAKPIALKQELKNVENAIRVTNSAINKEEAKPNPSEQKIDKLETVKEKLEEQKEDIKEELKAKPSTPPVTAAAPGPGLWGVGAEPAEPKATIIGYDNFGVIYSSTPSRAQIKLHKGHPYRVEKPT